MIKSLWVQQTSNDSEEKIQASLYNYESFIYFPIFATELTGGKRSVHQPTNHHLPLTCSPADLFGNFWIFQTRCVFRNFNLRWICIVFTFSLTVKHFYSTTINMLLVRDRLQDFFTNKFFSRSILVLYFLV